MVAQRHVKEESVFVVVHPLDDAPEAKCDPAGLGPMALRGSTRIALTALRAYLSLMAVLVLYHVLDLAGAFR